MAGPKNWTEEQIAQRANAGRGRGARETYSPWLFVQEFSSRGVQTRVPCMHFNRTIHTFSYLELALFTYAEFQSNFYDFNEQFPMDRGITLGCAAKLGIRHPRYPRGSVPVVMTLDALVSAIDADGVIKTAAWDVKPSSRLRDERTLAKLSLHKAYCAHVGIPHYLFTENSVSPNVIRNIMWSRTGVPVAGEAASSSDLFTYHVSQFEEDLFSCPSCRSRPTISHFCSQYEQVHNLEPGSGLRLFKLLLWQHRVRMDLDVKWIEREPIPRREEQAKLADVRRAA